MARPRKKPDVLPPPTRRWQTTISYVPTGYDLGLDASVIEKIREIAWPKGILIELEADDEYVLAERVAELRLEIEAMCGTNISIPRPTEIKEGE